MSTATVGINATEIQVTYADGTVGTFKLQGDGSWTQMIAGFAIAGYDLPNVMRVLANAVGTREIA